MQTLAQCRKVVEYELKECRLEEPAVEASKFASTPIRPRDDGLIGLQGDHPGALAVPTSGYVSYADRISVSEGFHVGNAG